MKIEQNNASKHIKQINFYFLLADKSNADKISHEAAKQFFFSSS